MARIVRASRWHFMRATNTPLADEPRSHRGWAPVRIVAQEQSPDEPRYPTGLFPQFRIKGCTSTRKPHNVFERLVAAENRGKLPPVYASTRHASRQEHSRRRIMGIDG